MKRIITNKNLFEFVVILLILIPREFISAQWYINPQLLALDLNSSIVDYNSVNDIVSSYNSDSEINSYASSITIKNNLYKVSKDEFIYAGTPRFTINGELPNLKTKINPFNAALTAGVTVGLAVALHINQNVAWWEGRYRPFYIRDDWNNALMADKFGHFMGGYFVSYFAREGLIFSGVSWGRSILLASAFGLLSQTYIEIKDGFAINTGFSPSDFAADFLGVSFFYAQHYVRFLQNFSPKWQYTPPGMIGVPLKARTNTFLDNYNATTAWWSIHMHNLLPGKNNFWPKWLNIAVGYGINGYYTSNISRRFVIGLDYNIVELLPDGVPFWNWLKQSFNLIKLPAPAVEFSSYGTKFFLLYPFSIQLGSIKL